MFVFELDAALLRFKHHSPALEALFQFPPTIEKNSHYQAIAHTAIPPI